MYFGARVLLRLIVDAQVGLVFVESRVFGVRIGIGTGRVWIVVRCFMMVMVVGIGFRRIGAEWVVRIVIGMIAYDELACVFRPTPVKEVVEYDEEFFAARFAAYDVKEEIETEVEHLQYAEQFG